MATAKKTTKKPSSKKVAAKKATRKAIAKKAPAKKAAVKKAPAKKAAVKKAPAKKAPAKKAPAKKAPAKKAPAKKAAVKKAPAKQATEAAPTRSATPAKRTRRASKIKPARTPVPKTDLPAKFVKEMGERLLVERAKYQHSAEEYRAEADALMEGREPGDVQFDEESGEGDTLAVERERDLALSAQARQAVDQIDSALERIAAGTYGICVTTHQPIPQERLKAIPWASERVEVKAGGIGRF